MVAAAGDQAALLWTQAATEPQTAGAAATPAGVPAAPAEPAAKPIWPWAVGGVGIAALGTGIALIAMGKESGCPNASYDECGKKRDLAPAGYVIGGTGLALIGAAVVGYVVGSRRASDTTVAVGPHGIAIGGSF
jgi:hypothetical protein